MRFAQENNFSNEIFFEKKFSNEKKTRKRWLKQIFSEEAGETDIFQTRKAHQKMRCGKMLMQKQFLWRIFYEVQKIQICRWKRNFKKKKRKRWQTYLHQITEIQKISSCGGCKQVVILQKKSIYLVRTNTIEKNNKKKGAKQQRR